MDTSTSSNSRYVLTILAVILLLTALALFALNALQIDRRLSAPSQGSKLDQRQAYLDGYLAARKKYQALCPLANITIKQLTGTVQSVSGNTIRVLQQSLDTDPAVDYVSDVRTVLVNANTILQRIDNKSREQLDSEAAALKNAKERLVVPPAPYNLTPLPFSALHVGQRVTIRSDSDVRLAQTIEAVSITLVQ